MASSGFVIYREVRWRVGTPDIEGIFGGMIASLPVDVGRNVVDVAGIFGIAAPGVADVMEIIRAEHMTAETPARAVSLRRHLHRAKPDRLHRTRVPAQMMKSRR